MPEESKFLFDCLFSKYKKVELDKKATAELLDMSVVTLDRMRKKGFGPSYKKKDGKGEHGSVRYPLHEIVKYLVSSNIKTL